MIVFSTVYENFYRKGDRKMTITFFPETSRIYSFFLNVGNRAKNSFNPYWQILENSSRNFSKIFIFWVVTQAVLLENSSSFFSKFKFWGVTQAVLLENSSIKNHGHLFSFFLILGRHTGRFTGKFIHSNFDWNFIGYVT